MNWRVLRANEADLNDCDGDLDRVTFSIIDANKAELFSALRKAKDQKRLHRTSVHTLDSGCIGALIQRHKITLSDSANGGFADNLAFETRFSNHFRTPPPGIRPASQEQAHELVANDPVYSPTILHTILTFGQWQFLSNTDLCISAHRSESPEYPKR